MGETLGSFRKQLRHIDLSYNCLGTSGMAEFAAALEVCRTRCKSESGGTARGLSWVWGAARFAQAVTAVRHCAGWRRGASSGCAAVACRHFVSTATSASSSSPLHPPFPHPFFLPRPHPLRLSRTPISGPLPRHVCPSLLVAGGSLALLRGQI